MGKNSPKRNILKELSGAPIATLGGLLVIISLVFYAGQFYESTQFKEVKADMQFEFQKELQAAKEDCFEKRFFQMDRDLENLKSSMQKLDNASD